MDTDNIDHMIAVLTAYKEGKTIQARHRDDEKTTWLQATEPCWDWETYDYRVKPEPRIVWINEYANGIWGCANSSKQAVKNSTSDECIACRKFVEVLEE